jgi:hypothetical protein
VWFIYRLECLSIRIEWFITKLEGLSNRLKYLRDRLEGLTNKLEYFGKYRSLWNVKVVPSDRINWTNVNLILVK